MPSSPTQVLPDGHFTPSMMIIHKVAQTNHGAHKSPQRLITAEEVKTLSLVHTNMHIDVYTHTHTQILGICHSKLALHVPHFVGGHTMGSMAAWKI